MTKAQKIRDLYAKGQSTREIADAVGCSDSYVRVCARQRLPGTWNHYRDNQRAAYQAGDYDVARTASKRAYRRARLSGASVLIAGREGSKAYMTAMVKTGRAERRNGVAA